MSEVAESTCKIDIDGRGQHMALRACPMPSLRFESSLCAKQDHDGSFLVLVDYLVVSRNVQSQTGRLTAQSHRLRLLHQEAYNNHKPLQTSIKRGNKAYNVLSKK